MELINRLRNLSVNRFWQLKYFFYCFIFTRLTKSLPARVVAGSRVILHEKFCLQMRAFFWLQITKLHVDAVHFYFDQYYSKRFKRGVPG